MTYEMEEMAENLGLRAKTSIETAPKGASTSVTTEEYDEGVITPSALCDKYRFVRLLGKGTQGRVYEAERLSDGECVAIKVLDIHSIQNWKEYELFWREAKTLQALRIKGVARFYEAMEDLNPEHPCAYLVQQQIHGKPLSDMLRDGTHFGMTDIFSFAKQIVEILQKLHRHDPPIIHRDIKPSNIMLEPDGRSYRVYLTDFGAVCNPMVQRGGSTVAGTFGYMPPEQLMGKVSAASDIYALGVTLVELLSGVSPADMEIVDLRLAIEKPLANVPYSVVSLLRSMTMPQVEQRQCDHGALLDAFRAFAKGDFSLGSEQPQKQSLPEWNASLKKVNRLGEKRNLSLWLALPEQTPRAIPRCYQKLNAYVRTQEFWHYFKKAFFTILVPLNIFIVPVKYICSLLLVLVGMVVGASVLLLYSLIVFLIIIASFVGGSHDEQKVIHALVTSGRKALATVVEVGYRRPNLDVIGGAIFRVRYAFNPPDDEQEGDLIHEVEVCNKPLLSPGDSLPILYSIEWENGCEVVRSIPFPLPTRRLAYSHCYCATRKGVIVDESEPEKK